MAGTGSSSWEIRVSRSFPRSDVRAGRWQSNALWVPFDTQDHRKAGIHRQGKLTKGGCRAMIREPRAGISHARAQLGHRGARAVKSPSGVRVGQQRWN